VLDLKATDPKELNRPLPPFVRWTSATILAVGSASCFVLVGGVVRHWGAEPNPAYFVAFLGTMGAIAAFLSIKVLRGAPIARPVDRPPRPWVIRMLGLPVFVFIGLSALVSNTLSERIELGLIALTGLGWFVWPRRFLPPTSEHGAQEALEAGGAADDHP